MTIEDFTIITSPLRKYLKVDLHQSMLFDSDNQFLRYWIGKPMGGDVEALLEYSEECQRELKDAASRCGIIPRFRDEYWPRLEEEVWRDLNSIQPVK